MISRLVVRLALGLTLASGPERLVGVAGLPPTSVIGAAVGSVKPAPLAMAECYSLLVTLPAAAGANALFELKLKGSTQRQVVL